MRAGERRVLDQAPTLRISHDVMSNVFQSVAQACGGGLGGLGLAVLESMAPGAPAQAGPADTPALPVFGDLRLCLKGWKAMSHLEGNPGSWSREHVLSPLE